MEELKGFNEIPTNFMNGDMSDLKQRLADFQTQTETYVRENPSQAMLSAIGAGFILRLLPVGAIVGMLVRLTVFLARPALFIYGAMAMYKHFTTPQAEEKPAE